MTSTHKGKWTRLALLGGLISMGLASQVQGGVPSEPPSFVEPVRPLRSVHQLALPRVDHDRLLAQDRHRASEGLPMRFALAFPVGRTPQDIGTWEPLREGDGLWRLRVSSPGARSLNFGFGRYHMPPGGELFIYTPDRSWVVGPFTDQDNETHGELWTPVLPGDEAVIEVKIPEEMRPYMELELTAVNHGYRESFLSPAPRAGVCHVDVVCPEADEWRAEIRSVGAISIGGNILCSGFLVNNTAEDLTPYFMTAEHCGIHAGNAPSVVVYWNYQRSDCGGDTDGDPLQFQTGAHFRAGWSRFGGTDFTLIELDDPPDPTFYVHWSGWDRSHGDPSQAVTLHHPGGQEKTISFENDPLTTTSLYETDIPGDGHYLRVEDWDLGSTEPGSSGAGLWNPDHRIVGQLTGGDAACGNDLSDWYGRVSVSWEGGGTPETRLRDWLDPADTGALNLDGLDACAPPVADFTVTPDHASVREPVTFHSTVTGGAPPYTYAWDMDGDGRKDCDKPRCVFKYRAPFNGNAWLVVSDSQPCGIPVTHAVVVSKVTVVHPNGGEILPTGTTCTVQWSGSPAAERFKVLYSLNKGRTWRVIARDIGGTTLDWEVPVVRRNKTRSLVKVIEYDANGKRLSWDTSNTPFTLGVVTITSPNGGEWLVSGSTHRIAWATHATAKEVATVRLWYSTNNGRKWKGIATLHENGGHFDWTVPHVDDLEARCRVKIRLSDGKGRGLGKDRSDWNFTIQPAPPG